MRPTGFHFFRERVGVDKLGVAAFDFHQIQGTGLVSKRQVFGVGRPVAGLPVAVPIFGQLASFTASVRLGHVHFIFAGLVGQVRDPSAIWAPNRETFCRTIRASQIAGGAFFCRCGPDVSASFDYDTFSSCRNVSGSDEF